MLFQRLKNTRAHSPSWKRNQDDQNKAMLVKMFYIQLIFLYPGVIIQYEEQLFLRLHRLILKSNVKHHVRMDVEVQNLDEMFLIVFFFFFVTFCVSEKNMVNLSGSRNRTDTKGAWAPYATFTISRCNFLFFVWYANHFVFNLSWAW